MIEKRIIPFIFILVVLCTFSGCSKKRGEEIRGFEKWTLVRETYMIFPDGTGVSQWKDETGTQLRFQLPDGTDLMKTTEITSYVPETDKKGLIGLDGMSDSAQKIVRSYYESRGRCYDLDEYLKLAYDDYCTTAKSGEKFIAHEIRQEVMPSAENDRYVVFLMALTFPKQNHFTGDTTCHYEGRIFDREDGSFLDIQDFFVSEQWEEIKQELAVLCAEDDTTITEADICDAIKIEDILIFQDYLEVWFPYGTWEKQEFDKGFGLKYDRLLEILQDWALPADSVNKE